MLNFFEKIKEFFFVILILGFLSGGLIFYAPFWVADKLVETEEEIDSKWLSATKDFIHWCEDHFPKGGKDAGGVDANWSFQRVLVNDISKEYVINNLHNKTKLCLSDKNFRIDLIENPGWLESRNHHEKKAFDAIPNELLKITSSPNINNLKTKQAIMNTDYIVGDTFEDFMLFSDEEQKQLFCETLETSSVMGCFEGFGNTYDVSILTLREYFIISKGCQSSCLMKFDYIVENQNSYNETNYIKNYEILSWIEFEGPNFDNEGDFEVGQYYKVLEETEKNIENLLTTYDWPDWLPEINL